MKFQVSMNSTCYNHRPLTILRHCEEETQDAESHNTKQTNQLSTIAKVETTPRTTPQNKDPPPIGATTNNR